LNCYEAYLDETGDDGGFPIMAVGGYLIRKSRARDLEVHWRQILSQYNIPYFHMVDCAMGSGVFSALTKDSRIEVQTLLMDLVKQHVELAVVSSTPLAHYEAASDIGDPYTQCVNSAAIQLTSLLVQKHGEAQYRLKLFYEAGHKNSGNALAYFNDKKEFYPNTSFSFIKKRNSGMIQAADILIWQYAKFIKDLTKESRLPRLDFRSIMKIPGIFLVLVPHKDTIGLSIFYNDSIDSAPDLEEIRKIFRPARPESGPWKEFFQFVKPDK
jgi:hypothetical protein